MEVVRRLLRACAHLTLLAAVAVGLASLAAQGGPVHPLSGRPIAPVMGAGGAGWLDRPERELEEAPSKALDIIGIAPGQVVADVGTGTGYLALRLAARVGTGGHVYANDIQPKMLEAVQKRLAANHVTNVTTILGTPDDPKLPVGTIDVAVLLDVYHEFAEPQQMLHHLRESLKPNGRLVLIEYRKEDRRIPIQPAHKMSVADAKLEVEAEGFTLSEVNEDLPRQHILFFTKRTGAG